MISLSPNDFECVGQLAKHCDNAKLCVSVDEAANFDMAPLLCDLFPEVAENWESMEEPWSTLIGGGTFEDCKGKQKTQLGLKRVFIYYAYARYLVLNSYNDTPNGSVTKTNDFSIPKPLKEVEQFADKYRTMGYRTWKAVERYMCLNRDLFDGMDAIECRGCGCNDTCNGGTQAKGYGIKGSNISRWDVKRY